MFLINCLTFCFCVFLYCFENFRQFGHPTSNIHGVRHITNIMIHLLPQIFIETWKRCVFKTITFILGCDMCYRNDGDTEQKLHGFHISCYSTKRSVAKTLLKDTLLKLCKVTINPSLLYSLKLNSKGRVDRNRSS
jgi:hypothetical protein